MFQHPFFPFIISASSGHRELKINKAVYLEGTKKKTMAILDKVRR